MWLLCTEFSIFIMRMDGGDGAERCEGEVFGKERSMNVVRVTDVDKESWAK